MYSSTLSLSNKYKIIQEVGIKNLCVFERISGFRSVLAIWRAEKKNQQTKQHRTCTESEQDTLYMFSSLH